MLGPADALALDQYQEQPQIQLQPQEPIVPGRRGRKRKVQQPEVAVQELSAVRQTEDDASLDILQPDLSKVQDDSMRPPQTPQIPSPDHSTGHLDDDIPLGYSAQEGLGLGGMTPHAFPSFTGLDSVSLI